MKMFSERDHEGHCPQLTLWWQIFNVVSDAVSKQEELSKQICDVEIEHNSLPSADDGSSGYESFKMFKDNDR
jgi:hypothetical protein